MSLRELGWGVFLAGLPFAHFVCPWKKEINQYAAQNFWAYGGIALLVGLSLAQRTPGRQSPNLPLACWVGWTVISVIGIWALYMRRDHVHPIGILPSFIHYTSWIWLYLAAMHQWSSELLSKLMRWIAWSGLILVMYGLIQLIGLDQFYRPIDWSKAGDELIGTIGNPTHYGLQLALFLPIFLWRSRSWWRVIAGFATTLIILTRSTSAIGCMFLVWVWWGWHHYPKSTLAISGCCGALGLWWLLGDPMWLNPEGRLSMWAFLREYYLVGQSKLQLTGAGLGIVLQDSIRQPAGWPVAWRHAHNEYFHILIEQGVIGLGIVLWGIGHAIWRWWCLPRTPLVHVFGMMGLLFLLSSTLHFSTHLWLLGMFGFLAYTGTYVLSAEFDMGRAEQGERPLSLELANCKSTIVPG